MSIPVVCPQCGKLYDIPDDRAGQTGKCACGGTIIIPPPVNPFELPSDQDGYRSPGAVGVPVNAAIITCPAALTRMIIALDVVSIIYMIGTVWFLVSIEGGSSSEGLVILVFPIMLGFLLSIFILITGYFLLNRRNWARIAMLILALLQVPGILFLVLILTDEPSSVAATGLLLFIIVVLLIYVLNMRATKEYCGK